MYSGCSPGALGLINWGGRIQRIQKTMASDKKGLSNWGGEINPVLTLYDIWTGVFRDAGSVVHRSTIDIHSSKIPFFGIQWKSCHGKQCRMCRTFLKDTGFCANPQSAIRIGFCTSNLWVFQRNFSIPKELSFWQVKINSAARVFTAIAPVDRRYTVTGVPGFAEDDFD